MNPYQTLVQLEKVAIWVNGSVSMDQTSYDEPPSPATQFDYELHETASELFSLVRDVRVLVNQRDELLDALRELLHTSGTGYVTAVLKANKAINATEAA